MNRTAWAWFIPLAIIVVTVCLVFWQVTSPVPYAYDESDYMFAGTQGFQANYLNPKDVPFIEFVQKGLELARNKGQRQSFSQFVRESGDISFYRHYHGPLYAYWIALWKAFGADSESTFRGSGLVLHGIGAVAIFWLFVWVFPELPVPGAFIAALIFAMNRTALVTATTITQHIVFEFLAILSFFAAGRFIRTNERVWWHVTVTLLACAFAAVEISIILIAAVLVTVALFNWRELPRLIGTGLITFLLVLLILWPVGVLKLDALKGYLYLGYMSLSRKTFSPIGPVELWSFRITTYPFEFIVPLLALIFVLVRYRDLSALKAAIPTVLYAIAFLAATMFITLPYIHYSGSLLASLCILCGVAGGWIWERSGSGVRWGMVAIIFAMLLRLDQSLYSEMAPWRQRVGATSDVIAYLKSQSTQPAGSAALYVPFEYIPTLHFYIPALKATGYTEDTTMNELATTATNNAPALVLCTSSTCDNLVSLLREGFFNRVRVTQPSTWGDPVESVTLRPVSTHPLATGNK